MRWHFLFCFISLIRFLHKHCHKRRTRKPFMQVAQVGFAASGRASRHVQKTARYHRRCFDARTWRGRQALVGLVDGLDAGGRLGHLPGGAGGAVVHHHNLGEG